MAMASSEFFMTNSLMVFVMERVRVDGNDDGGER
jgi:hypothetical protein